jgi:hypothetical protein
MSPKTRKRIGFFNILMGVALLVYNFTLVLNTYEGEYGLGYFMVSLIFYAPVFCLMFFTGTRVIDNTRDVTNLQFCICLLLFIIAIPQLITTVKPELIGNPNNVILSFAQEGHWHPLILLSVLVILVPVEIGFLFLLTRTPTN